MRIGQRIKHARLHRGLTLKELGLMVGFDENTADVRIAQYESSTRTPKADMREKLGKALEINPRYFFDSDLYAAEDIMFLLFEVDGVHKLDLTPFKDGTRTRVNVHVNYNLVDDFLVDWMEKKRELAGGTITKHDYTEWILNWPYSASKKKDNDEDSLDNERSDS